MGRNQSETNLYIGSVYEVMSVGCGVFASRHSCVHFLKTSTSKSALTQKCFTVLTSTCASCHNVVFFSTAELPKVLRQWCVFTILTSKCASCHRRVPFFNVVTSKSVPRWLCTICPDGCAPAALPSLLFNPPEAPNIGKKTVFHDFSTFSRPP